jgi:eukaryotic-like serine/threonine-protein kinase
MALNPGDILYDRYEIIEVLGRGGFAITYKACDLKKPGNPLCVVKEIKPPQSTDPLVWQEANQRFQREVAALQRLGHHSRIPEYYNHFLAFQENRNFYLVQEYIEGNPLSKELANKSQWNEENTIAFLQDILETLSFVHENGVIHRDIKPSNLIRRKSDDKIVLIDFGAVKEISRLETTESGHTRTRTIYTEGYAPPEQMHGNPKFCSDIYAAGIVAIQAVAGLDVEDIFTYKKTGDRVWHYPIHDRPMIKISSQLEKILNKMVRYHFNDRYQSAAEVLWDLQSLVTASSQQKQRSYRNKLRRVIVPIETAKVRVKNSIAPEKPSPPNLPDGLSAGEKILLKIHSPWLKQKGVKEFADANSEKAFNLFKRSWHEDFGQDPETLIYTNNAFLDASNADYYTIAVALPVCRLSDNSSLVSVQAKEFLCGVAQAQTAVNLGLINSSDRDFPGQGFLPSKAINGKGIKVIIADDANDEEEAKQRAIALVNLPDILAVVGHASSDMTMAVVDIYNKNKLVLMSPSAATEELTDEPKKFFFRTQYTSSLIAQDLADYLLEKKQHRSVILYNQGSPFGASFVKEYTKYFQDTRGGTIVRISNFDISKQDFNAARALKEIQANGETAIVLVPNFQDRNSLNRAFEIVKLNADRNWIVGAWILMCPQMLEFASQQPQKLLKKLVFSIGWHPLSCSNKEFPQQARTLWAEEANTRIASAYDATRALIQALEMQAKPSREGTQQMLSSPDFTAYGATGTIKFNSPNNGDRKNPPRDLVHIVKSPKEQFGLAFVPVKSEDLNMPPESRPKSLLKWVVLAIAGVFVGFCLSAGIL